MMRHWLTRADLPLRTTTIKRFEPSHWTVDFARGSMASVVSTPGETRLFVTTNFTRQNDLVGLIYSSDDAHVHVGHRRHVARDYSNCTLRFRWRSNGLAELDVANGPTLTIEGMNAVGIKRSWYVRLWNYAEGEPADALISLPFEELRAGFAADGTGERVDVGSIDRMFISLVPPGFDQANETRFEEPLVGTLELTEISCTGSGSTVRINDCFTPAHDLRVCTAYDDAYHLTPERVLDGLERLGYRKRINHYVGMSHYPALGGTGWWMRPSRSTRRQGAGTKASQALRRNAVTRSSGQSQWSCSTASALKPGSNEPSTDVRRRRVILRRRRSYPLLASRLSITLPA